MSGGTDPELDQFEDGDLGLSAFKSLPGGGPQLQAGFRRKQQNGQPQPGNAQSILNSRLGGESPGGLF